MDAEARTKTNDSPAVRAGIPRSVEVFVALIGLICAAPLLALAAFAVRVTSRGPALFRQKRIGRGGRTFVLYKLRTMRLSKEGTQVTARGDVRITPVGRILRGTKLDELPELWNVIKGEMSLVGPRPEVPRYVDPDDSVWQLVLKVRPGITDPMTLRLRNEEVLMAGVSGDRERFYLETLQPFKLKGYLEYLRCRSWWSDVKVLWGTAVAVIIPRRAPHPTVGELFGEVMRVYGTHGEHSEVS